MLAKQIEEIKENSNSKPKQMTREEIFKRLQQIPAKNIRSFSSQITQSFKYKQLKQAIIDETSYLPNNCKFTERLYHIAYGLRSRPLCKHCKEKFLKFKHFNQGYQEYCSVKCAGQSKEIRDRIKQTNLRRYGVETPAQSEEVKKRIKQTYLKKYGVENPMYLERFKEKLKQTNLERYGVQYPTQSEQIKEKVKRTNLKKYGAEHTFQSEEIKEKIKQTMVKKYGVENPMHLEQIKEKMKQTVVERYGVENSAQSEEIKKKLKQTNLERYGVEHTFQSEEIKEKIKQTMVKKYGVEHPLEFEKFKKKFQQTNLQKYGVAHPMQSDEISQKAKQTRLENTFKYITSSKRIGEEYECLTLIEEYDGVKHNYLKFRHKKCGHIFEYSIANGVYPLCPKCYHNTSKFEAEVRDFVEEFYDNLTYNSRKIIPPKEIDIYVPDINLAIECNGIYWHNEEFVGKHYHQEKLLQCWKKQIHLVQIFEDEWLFKKEIVKSMLRNRFGKITNRIFARKCQIYEIQNDYAENWLDDNHIQGRIKGRHFGLVYDNKLVSLITVGKPRFKTSHDLEIYRFCSLINTQVTGGLSRLLSHIRKVFNNLSIITYADLRFGHGGGYQKVGFKFLRLTDPGYFYMKQHRRYSRQQFQKHKLESILEYFDPNLTEEQNMFENGYFRVYDCGNAVYELV